MSTKQNRIECITELPASYRVRVFYTEDNEKKCYSKTFKYNQYPTKGDALRAAIEDRDRVQSSLHSATAKVWTVSGVYEMSKKYIVISAKTAERHQHFYAYAIGDKYGDRPIHSITTADIQECLNTLQAEKSDDYINRVLSIWRRIYKTCNILGLEIPDRTLSVVVPKSKKPAKPKRQPLTQETLEAVIKCLQPDPFRHDERYQYERSRMVYLVWLLYYTGMRPAEALALKMEDISLDREELYIYKAVGSTKTETTKIVQAKTTASVRTVYLNEFALEVCRELIKSRRSEYLFTRYNGELWDIDDLSDLMYQLTKKEGINFRLYDLRHDFATRMLEKGESPAVVRDLMGHTNFNMSIQYARSSASTLANAMKDDSANVLKFTEVEHTKHHKEESENE